ncbi:MAG: hypothetical protein V4687_06810 [Bacteroidota bacterium]
MNFNEVLKGCGTYDGKTNITTYIIENAPPMVGNLKFDYSIIEGELDNIIDVKNSDGCFTIRISGEVKPNTYQIFVREI